MVIACIEKKNEEERNLNLPFRLGSVEDRCWAFLRESGEIVLFEWKTYEIDANGAKVIIPGLENIQRSSINKNTFTFTFKNYIGKSRLIIEDSHGKRREFPLIVLSEKFGKIALEYWGVIDLNKIEDIKEREKAVEKLIERFNILCQTLTDDITRISSQLNFSIKSPTAFTVEESDEPMNELFAYHYLRSNKERIIEAFETVLRKIKRKLVVEEEWLRPDEVDETTPETLLSIVQHPEYLAPAGEGVLIAEYLNGYGPTKVLSFQKYESFDTPENRFAKYFLGLLVEWGERVVRTFGSKVEAEINSVKELLEELDFIKSDGIWEDVGEMTLFPYTSQTLLKGDGYRDLLKLYREFTVYVPFFGELQKAIENKDIAKLYEYWCFFKLVEELGEILENPEFHITLTPEGSLSQGINAYVKFKGGWKLYYNREFHSKSYSVPVRPDFSLVKGEEIIGVFDAKFKVDIVPYSEFADKDKEMETRPTLETWAKLEDIYKMHTYRDALNAEFAIVLYPGDRSVFFDKINKKCIGDLKECEGKFELNMLLDKEKAKLEGIGYLSLKP
ncbi:hypothetical protein DRN44_00680 [Thermococci archaeon]|nr:MAG: hypothetical protein DRN44_00680 [Thermococci archaeon]